MPVVPRETTVKFESILRQNGLDLTDEQTGKLLMYQRLLLKWNKDINLVSRSTTEAEIQFTHFIHSLSPFFFCSFSGPIRIMDMGSGGGLPGIPLSILKPEFRIVLVDSIAKKVKAMQSMVGDLALPNVEVVRARAEDAVRLGLVHDRFDLVLARAVAPLADLVTWSVNAVRRGSETLQWTQSGRTTMVRLPALMAWKGGDIAGELDGMNRLTGHRGIEFPLLFPGSEEAGLEEKKMVIVELHAGGGKR